MNNFHSLIKIFIVPVIILFSGLAFSAELKADNGPMIRIAVAQNIAQVKIKMAGAYEISNPLNREVLEKGLKFPVTVVSKGERGLKLGTRNLYLNRLRFYARRDVSVVLGGKERRYRGYVDIILNPKNQLLVVNQLEVEDYIRGVLYHEVSHRWPMDSLKVQAVAARSYAIYQIKMNSIREFDVTNDIYSQVYGGRTGERYRTNLAVDGTLGEILTYQGKVLPAYFHATCGGYTEDAKALWPRQDLPPLRGGIRCIYCRESPHYFWKKSLPLREIQEKLFARGFKIGIIADIAIPKRNASDRIETLLLTDHEGKQLSISGKDFREAVGPNIIRSNNYYVLLKGYTCDFFGKGWGHGVGMCQWGVQGMASQGFTYDKILQFYYPGTVLTTLKSFDPARTF